MIKQLVEIDFAKHLAKLENVIKDNDMIWPMSGMSAPVYIRQVRKMSRN